MKLVAVLAGVMWVHACCGTEQLRVTCGELGRILAGLSAATGENHSFHTGIDGTLYDRVTIGIETVVGQIGADVDQ